MPQSIVRVFRKAAYLSVVAGICAVPTAHAAIDILTPAADRPFLDSSQASLGSVSPFEQMTQLTEADLVDLFTGASTYSLPLHIPPGFTNVTPTLALDYSSQRVDSASFVGHGWNIQLGRIERVQKPGSSGLYEQNNFRLDTPTLHDDLVLLSSTTTEEVYGLRRESAFPRIIRSLTTNSWTITETNGTVHVYGGTSSTRETNSDESKVFAWAIQETVDLHGNRIDYAYHQFNNLLYPESIRYGSQSLEEHPFEIIFEPFDQTTPLENQPNEMWTYRAGFLQKHQYRVDGISVQIDGIERIRYEFDYSEPTILDRSELMALRSVSPASFNTAPQTTAFEYYQSGDSNAQVLRHLKTITLPSGGKYAFLYAYSNALLKNGVLANPEVLRPTPVVTELLMSDFTGRSDKTSFQYEGGFYYTDSSLDSQSAGFSLVTITDPVGHVTEHSFHQGRGLPSTPFRGEDLSSLIGREYQTVRRDVSKNETQTTQRRWLASENTSSHWFVRSDFTLTTTDDGTDTRSTAIETIHDPATGLALESIEYGLVTADSGGFFDIKSDSRRQVVDYASNPELHIHSYPATVKAYDHGDNLITQMIYQYDNLPIESITHGNKTHDRRWLSQQSRDITTQYSHETTGQISTITSPRNGLTTLLYGADDLYPIQVTNPLQQTTTYTFDLFTGQATGSLDPNGMHTKRTLDGRGRWLLQEETDQAGLLKPRIRRSFDESVFPSSVETTLVLNNGEEAKTIEYRDGFGRTIQRRTKQIDDLYSVSDTSYDAFGRESGTSIAVHQPVGTFAAIPNTVPRTSTTYDAFDRVTVVEDQNGSTSHEYQLAGSLKVVIDSNLHRTDYEFDSFDRLSAVKEHDGEEIWGCPIHC